MRRALPPRSCRALLAAGLLLTAAAQASTVVPMSVPTLADHAAQVIVGRVTAIRSYWAENPRRIESAVSFEQVEYLKGRLADARDTFELVVPGGEVDGMRMALCCAPELRVGDRWMLFLLPSYHTHPVVGVFQGAFLITSDADGVERVVTRTHGRETPVLGVGIDGFVQYAAGEETDAQEQLVAAHNMRLVASTQRSAPPIAYADFVQQLAPMLAASRQFELTAPAGRADIAPYRAVPLQYSRLERQRRADKKPGAAPPRVRSTAGAKPLPADAQPDKAAKEVQP